MNQKVAYLAFTILACGAHGAFVYAKIAEDVQSVFMQKLDDSSSVDKKIGAQKNVRLTYTNEDLIDVINQLAAQKGINVVFPLGADAITQKVTLSMDDRFTIDEAWQILNTILDVAGYSFVEKDTVSSIVKTTQNTAKEPLPLFVNTAIEHIPNSDQRIRYIYYLANLKVAPADARNEIAVVLKALLTAGEGQSPSSVIFEENTNAVLLTDKANNIRAAVAILKELDKSTFQEKLEFVTLRYTKAGTVAQLFANEILKDDDSFNRYRLETKKVNDAYYFSKNVRVIAEERTNSLMVLGRSQEVERVLNFVKDFIDVELESGRSILHIYQLQYLDAYDLAMVLTNIVSNQRGSQSSGDTLAQKDRSFENVIIKADRPSRGNDQSGDDQIYKYSGSNKLIIAARNDDWEVLRTIIEQLDKPQPQVIIEVLIADITLSDPSNKTLGAITRTPANIPFFKNMEFQSAQLRGALTDQGISTNNPTPGPSTIHSNLLQAAFNTNGSSGTDFSLAKLTEPGSSILSLGDNNGNIWSVMQALQRQENTKVLSQPHIIAMHNVKATVSIGESRLVVDEAVGSAGGTTTQKRKRIDANLKVEITPRISSAEEVNLSINITINEFQGTTSNNRNNRTVVTNANMRSGNILALGGLIKTNIQEGTSKTPILGDIPILGWLFKRKTFSTIKSNLVVFLAPTIVQPRLRGGMGEYTKDYLKVTKDYAHEGQLFETLQEPITRWFFKTSQDLDQTIHDFMAKDETKNAIINEEDTTHLQERTHKKQRSKSYAKKQPRRDRKTTVAEKKETPMPSPAAHATEKAITHTAQVPMPQPQEEQNFDIAQHEINLAELAIPLTTSHAPGAKNTTSLVADAQPSYDEKKAEYKKQLSQLLQSDSDPITHPTLRT